MKQPVMFFAEDEGRQPASNDLLWKMVAAVPAPAADEDLRLARASRANVLLIGDDPQVSDAAAYLAGSAGSGTVTMWTTVRLRLPRPATPEIVVIARRIDRLDPSEQQELLQWLTMASRATRVISTASASLWPMVCEGAFNPELYYRLNTVCIRVS